MTNTNRYFAKHGCDMNAEPLRFQTDIQMHKEYNSICFDTGGVSGYAWERKLGNTSPVRFYTDSEAGMCSVSCDTYEDALELACFLALYRLERGYQTRYFYAGMVFSTSSNKYKVIGREGETLSLCTLEGKEMKRKISMDRNGMESIRIDHTKVTANDAK